ncbi:hypothetical protein Hanom_Chr06g00572311 [Helianthus anomalus]
MENDDSEDESESDSEEDLAEEEVFEEGEVRPIIDAKKDNQVEDHVPVPEVGFDVPMGDSDSHPVGIGKSPVAQGSHVVVESPGLNVNMGNNDMHGEVNVSAHEDGINDVSQGLGDCPIPVVNIVAAHANGHIEYDGGDNVFNNNVGSRVNINGGGGGEITLIKIRRTMCNRA